MSDKPAMSLVDVLDVIHRHRRDAVVLTTMGAAREWQQLEPHPKDFVYMPSSMGQGPPLGLGIAIAQPEQRVIVVNGDGCLLMNLGCLVTITAQAPKNFTLIIIDNGVYEVTGWSSEGSGSICPALYAPVSDSGQAVVHLVYGGDWGIRLRLENSQGPWSTDSTDQHGEPYLMLIDGNDIIRE